MQKRLRRETAVVLDAIASMGYLIEVIDKDGYYLYLSSNCDYDRYTPDQMVGKHITKVYGGMDQYSVLLDVIKTCKPEIDIELSYQSRKDGRIYQWLYSAYPMFENGALSAVVAVYRQMDELAHTMEAASSVVSGEHRIEDVKAGLAKFGDVAQGSRIMKETLENAKRLAGLGTVLLSGESGVGKNMLAQAIHTYLHGQDPKAKLVTVSCAMLPDQDADAYLFGVSRGSYASVTDRKGLFDEARGGTLFFDGIQYLSPALQAKLLRVLDTGKVRRLGAVNEIHANCMFIASVDQNLSKVMANGQLIDELFYRLSSCEVRVPALRERKEDIELIANLQIRQISADLGKGVERLSPDTLDYFKRYDWPGNVREMQKALRYAILISDKTCFQVEIRNLPPYLRDSMYRLDQEEGAVSADMGDCDYRSAVKRAEEKCLKRFHSEYIPRILVEEGGNMTSAAKRMGISRQHLYKIVKKYGVRI